QGGSASSRVSSARCSGAAQSGSGGGPSFTSPTVIGRSVRLVMARSKLAVGAQPTSVTTVSTNETHCKRIGVVYRPTCRPSPCRRQLWQIEVVGAGRRLPPGVQFQPPPLANLVKEHGDEQVDHLVAD